MYGSFVGSIVVFGSQPVVGKVAAERAERERAAEAEYQAVSSVT